MTVRWRVAGYMLMVGRTSNTKHAQGQRKLSTWFSASHSLFPKCCVRKPFSGGTVHLSRTPAQSRKHRSIVGWLCRIGFFRLRLSCGLSCLSTSASRESTGISRHMLWIRNTLDSVSKAVSGTHTHLLSRIARLKPSTVLPGKWSEPNLEAESSPQTGNTVAQLGPQTGNTVAQLGPQTGNTVAQLGPQTGNTVAQLGPQTGNAVANLPPQTSNAIAQSPPQLFIKLSSQVGKKSSADVIDPKKATSACEATSKQASELLQSSYFTADLDDTYNSLVNHVDAYFGSAETQEERKPDQTSTTSVPGPSQSCPSSAGHIAVFVPISNKLASSPPPAVSTPNVDPSPSPKKGIGHYLSYSGPTVQAFVGNYIVPLVPRFRSEPKMIEDDKEKTAVSDNGPSKGREVTEIKDQKEVDEKARQLLLQREKIIARVSVDNRTRALVQALQRATDVKLYISRVEDLNYHLLEFPETRGVAVKEKVIPCLLRLRQAGDTLLQAAVREALALVGYADPVKGRGIRLLSIDGGGTRGLVALQTLRKLEGLTGKPIHQLFDYICGVSTGAILAFMLGVFQIPLDECEEMYRRLGSNVFKQNVIVGTVKMGWSHAFYDSEAWESMLKERMGSGLMIETSRNCKCPKVAAVSTIVNRGTPLKAFVFRNYNLPPGVRSHYLGGCEHKLWEAIRASSAAPGYFQEFVLGSDLHQDGGLLINNPTALAIHECKCLWPSTPVQCVVSLGTGRFESFGRNGATHTSLRTKLSNVISSATDTEEVHNMLDALLPPDTYFRFNPYMTEDIPLDESRQEKLDLLQSEGRRYLERNEEKLKRAAGILRQEKSTIQRVAEWLKLKADMYDGLSLSKL